jgi:thymidylate synthase ThyX
MVKHTINAKIVADSINSQGNRITTFVLTYPRIIHAEMMTHRVFSRNAASSRAIPFNKMVKSVEDDPFIPIAWQKDHKGMQGTKYIVDPIEIKNCIKQWLFARDEAVNHSENLHGDYYIYDGTDIPLQMGVTKQLCNRLLEPYQWYTCLVTTTELENFYKLRCPQYYNITTGTYFKSRKDWIKFYLENGGVNTNLSIYNTEYWQSINYSQAEIHIQALAEAMWDVQNESKPSLLEAGEWHIPFGDKIFSEDKIEDFLRTQDVQWVTAEGHDAELEKIALKIATARAARLSYMTFDGEIDYNKDIQLHDMLLNSKHMSPFEHCARVMTEEEYHLFIRGKTKEDESDNPKSIYGWCNNFKGFIQYRYLLEHGTGTSETL